VGETHPDDREHPGVQDEIETALRRRSSRAERATGDAIADRPSTRLRAATDGIKRDASAPAWLSAP